MSEFSLENASEQWFEGGSLWQTLSIEEEILKKIFKDVDAITLKNLELTSLFYRNFVMRTFVWKKKFEFDYPDFITNKEFTDVTKRMKNYSNLDNHLKFKISCLKLWHLDLNWKNKNLSNKNINLKKIFSQETIKIMDSNFILTVKNNFSQTRDAYETCGNIFDINKWEKNEHFQRPCSFQILSAHISEDHLVLLGQNVENSFLIKLFSTSDCELVKQTDKIRETEITKWSEVKMSKDSILLFESNFWGLESNTDEDCDAIHIFDYKNTEAENIEHVKKIVLDLPATNYLTMFSFDEDFLIGSQDNHDIVELWDLKKLALFGDQMKAPVIWRIGVSERNTSAIFSEPFAFIGKSNGRCDIWNVTLNTRIRSLEHDGTGANIFLTIKKILVLKSYILTLTQRGKIYVWDKDRCLNSEDNDSCLDRPDKDRCLPVWTCSSSVSGNVICDLYADTTRLVCLESNMRDGTQWLVVKDMWHCQPASQNRGDGTKRKFDGPGRFERRRKFAFDL